MFHAGGDTEAKINKTMPYSVSFRPLSYIRQRATARGGQSARYLIQSTLPNALPPGSHIHIPMLNLPTHTMSHQSPMYPNALGSSMRIDRNPTASPSGRHQAPPFRASLPLIPKQPQMQSRPTANTNANPGRAGEGILSRYQCLWKVNAESNVSLRYR